MNPTGSLYGAADICAPQFSRLTAPRCSVSRPLSLERLRRGGLFGGSLHLFTVLDLPGIVEGASSGRGRGRQVIAVAKVSSTRSKSALQPKLTLGLSHRLQISYWCVPGVHSVRRLPRADPCPLQMMLDVTK